MTTSVRSKTTISFWLKKMVILLKSWRGNIVVKLFTTFVSEYFKIFLRNSWENLGNSSREIPRNWFWRPFCYKFSLVFLKNWLQEIPWIELREFPRNGLQEIPRTWFLGIGNEKFLGKAVDIFTGFSCERFLGISADFPQNCYLGSIGG